jgi:hypothetical protein
MKANGIEPPTRGKPEEDQPEEVVDRPKAAHSENRFKG